MKTPTRRHAARMVAPLRASLRLVYLCLLLGLPCKVALAQQSSGDEYDIRAAMLLNLAKFTDWPAWKHNAEHPDYVVCIVGSDPLTLSLERTIKSQPVGSRTFVLQHLVILNEANRCHILYMGTGSRRSVARTAYTELEKNGVLTVSESPNAENPGQVVGLPAMDDHIRIDINLGAAQRSAITFSSKLLRLATVTH